jgi:protein Mpv17
MWRWYGRQLQQRPLITKSLTAALIMAGGDAAQQCIIEKPAQPLSWRYEPVRTLRSGVFGGVIIGPLMHNWFALLERIVPAGAAAPWIKVALDQAIIGPIVTASFFSSMGLMEGKSMDEIKLKVEQNFWETYMMNIRFWPPVQLINFYFIPLQYRVLWANGAQFCWGMYLSHQANKGNKKIE